MAAPTQVDNLLIYDAAGEVFEGALTVKMIVFRNGHTGAGYFTLKDGDGTVLGQIYVLGNTSLPLPFGDKGFHFPSGLEVDRLPTAGVVYVFLAGHVN